MVIELQTCEKLDVSDVALLLNNIVHFFASPDSKQHGRLFLRTQTAADIFAFIFKIMFRNKGIQFSEHNSQYNHMNILV